MFFPWNYTNYTNWYQCIISLQLHLKHRFVFFFRYTPCCIIFMLLHSIIIMAFFPANARMHTLMRYALPVQLTCIHSQQFVLCMPLYSPTTLRSSTFIACICLFALINCQLSGSLTQREVGVSIHAKMHLVHSLPFYLFIYYLLKYIYTG